MVSVILIVKNGEKFISQAITSVLQQTLKPLEILVIDGNSTDKTETICKTFPEVTFIRQKDRGIPNAYNQGIETSKGKFISFISHDDIWKPDKLEKQINYMLEHPHIEFTITKAKFFLEAGYNLPTNFKKELLNKGVVAYIMETLVTRKTLFQKVGVFDTSYPTGEDLDWFSRVLDYNIPYGIIQESLVLKRIHDKNSSLNYDEFNKLVLKLLRESIKRKRLTKF